MAGSLFERLTTADGGKSIDEDESIRMHLMRMLTTRQGAVQALPEYGLPDLNDLNFSRSDLILHCCTAIEECISQYEPRLCNVKVSQATGTAGPAMISGPAGADPFTMAFNINATKQDANGKITPWRWTVELDGTKIVRGDN